MKYLNSLILLTIIIVGVIVAVLVARAIASSIRSKTPMEQDAVKKGLLAYFLTDSPLLGWLVYNRKNPKNKL